MTRLSYLCSLALLSLSISTEVSAACTSSWTNVAGGNWEATGDPVTNWSLCIPGQPAGATDEADFLSIAAANVTVTLQNSAGGVAVSPGLNIIKFDAGAMMTSYSIEPFGASQINLLGTPTIHLVSGNQTIDAPVTTTDNTLIQIDNTTGADVLFFGPNSKLTCAPAGKTLNINIASIDNTSTLVVQSQGANVFGGNMAIVIGTPGSTMDFNVINAQGNFGTTSPSITLQDHVSFVNQSGGTHFSSAATAVTLNNGAQFDGQDLLLPIPCLSLTLDSQGGTDQILFKTVSNLPIANDWTFVTNGVTNAKYLVQCFNPLAHSVTVMGATGCTVSVGGTLTIDTRGTLTFLLDNEATVSSPSNGTGILFQQPAMGSSLAFNNGSVLHCLNNTTGTISVDSSNIGAHFSAAGFDLTTDDLAGVLNNQIINENQGAVSQGIGSKMDVNSVSLRRGTLSNTSSVGGISNVGGTSIGAQLNIGTSVTLNALSTLSLTNSSAITGAAAAIGVDTTIPTLLIGNIPNTILANNSGTITGTGHIGCQAQITASDVSPATGTTFTVQNFGGITGASTNCTGVVLNITNGSFITPLTGVVVAPHCTNSGNITTSSTGCVGAFLNIGQNLLLQDDVANPGSLICQNQGSVNGNSTSIGAKVSVPNGNVTVTNQANLVCINSGLVTLNEGIGAWLDFPNGLGTFTLDNTNASIILSNTGPMTTPGVDFGVGAQMTANPQLAMSAGTFTLTNTANLTNQNSSTTAFVVVGNLDGGINWTGGTINITNLGMGNSVVRRPAVQLNVAPSLAVNDGCILNITNDMSLTTCLPAAAQLNITLGNLFLNGSGVVNLLNSMPFNIQQNLNNSVGASLIIPGNLTLSNTSQLNLSNTCQSTMITSLSNTSRGTLVTLIGDVALHDTSSITLLTDASTAMQNTIGTSSLGNFFSGANLTLDATAQINLTNTNNNNAIDNAWGNLFSVNNADITGKIILSDTNSTLSNGAKGNELRVGGTFNQTAGLVVVHSTGSTADATSFGSLIRSTTMPINISGGDFINDDHTQADIVHVSGGISGGRLAGGGIFIGETTSTNTAVTNDGTVYPGDPYDPLTQTGSPSVGTMQINGTYTNNAGSNFFINIHDVATFSKLQIHGTGTAQLNGGTVTISQLSGGTINQSDTYDILVADNGVTGMFDSTVQTTMGFPPLTPILTYPDPNTVRLIFAASPPPPPPPSPPPPAPPSFIPSLTSYSVSFEALFDLINRDNLILEREMQRMRLRYQQEVVVPAREVSNHRIAQANIPAPAIITHNPFSINMIANAIPAKGKELAFARFREEVEQQRMDQDMYICTYQDRPWNFFIGPVGDVGTIKTKQNQLGAAYWVAGGLTSFNYVFAHAGIGLFVDYNKVKADVDQNWGNFEFDMAHSSLYATYSPKGAPKFALHSIVGGSYEWYNIHRHTTTNTANAKTQGGEFDALLSGEYVFSGSPCSSFSENFSIIPRAGLQYIYVTSHQYKEHGAGVSDLNFNSRHAQSLRTILDLWMKYKWEWTNVTFTPEFNVGWQREFLDKNQNASFSRVKLALPTSSVTTFGAGRNTFLAGLDLFLEFYEKYALEASYDFQWNSLIRDNGFYLGFHARF